MMTQRSLGIFKFRKEGAIKQSICLPDAVKWQGSKEWVVSDTAWRPQTHQKGADLPVHALNPVGTDAESPHQAQQPSPHLHPSSRGQPPADLRALTTSSCQNAGFRSGVPDLSS